MDYPCNGFQPSPKDPKDWKIEKLMGVGFDETLLTPASHDFRDKNHAILNQLSTQSCVGHCIAQAAYTAMNVAGRTGEYLFLPSPLRKHAPGSRETGEYLAGSDATPCSGSPRC